MSPSDQVSFRGIKKRTLNFDQEGYNAFEENEFDFNSSFCNEAGVDIDFWDYLERKALFISKTVFGDDLPELRLTSKTSTLQQLLELCNIHEQLNNATSPVNDHSPGLKIVNLMDNGLHQHQIMFLEQHA